MSYHVSTKNHQMLLRQDLAFAEEWTFHVAECFGRFQHHLRQLTTFVQTDIFQRWVWDDPAKTEKLSFSASLSSAADSVKELLSVAPICKCCVVCGMTCFLGQHLT